MRRPQNNVLQLTRGALEASGFAGRVFAWCALQLNPGVLRAIVGAASEGIPNLELCGFA
jgi:hypothetical protein